MLTITENVDETFTPNSKQLFEEFSDMVYRIAFVQMKNAMDTDDIFQEVFLRLVKNLDKLHSKEHAKAWLIRVTINCCNSYFTSNWQKKTTTLEDYQGVVNNLDFQQLELLEAIKKLSPKHQQVIHLFYYEGYSIKEMASLLDSNENTIKSHLHRAKSALKDIWKGKEDF